MAQEAPPPAYRIIQKGPLINIGVADFESLVTHHPSSNANARVVDGVVFRGEAGRRHAVIGGQIDEIAIGVPGGTNGLAPDQVLQKKDFIFENPTVSTGGRGARDVDVPSPFSGYVGRAGGKFGTVDIYDRQGGTLLARVLHLDPIHVTAGSTIEYGQALGVQSNKGLPSAGKHVHMEVDTAHYQAYQHYVDDLVSGRLPMDASRRTRGIEPRGYIDDGVIRIGESSDEVRNVQQHLNEQGVRDANGRPLPVDGVYRLSMQAAVLRFQAAQGLHQTGDIDQATLRAVPAFQAGRIEPLDAADASARTASDAAQETGGRGRLHHLLEQARTAVERLDGERGRSYDAISERLAGSLAALASHNGFERIDRIVLSDATATLARGENVFVVQDDASGTGNRIVCMRTEEAVSTPLEQSLSRLEHPPPALSSRGGPCHVEGDVTRTTPQIGQ